jgi:hypothetical protein
MTRASESSAFIRVHPRPMLVTCLASMLALAPARAQMPGEGDDGRPPGPGHAYHQWGDPKDIVNVPYDGRFTFVRIRFEPMSSGGGRWGRRDLKWDHDVPRAERNFTKILREITGVRPSVEGGNIFTLDDPQLTKFPVAYLSEPGFWTMSEKEVSGLRNYLLKGGFMIIDDFVGPHWMNLEEQFRRALPEARFVRLDVSHPIFDSFFHIKTLSMEQFPYGPQFEPQYYGIFEDNDPKKRLMVIANYNNDLGDYMEWSDAGFLPIQITNEAYKLGVNYVIYGMTR